MARFVKVSTLGPRPITVDLESTPKDVILKMKDHWTKELDQVLPDKPDIIVLHEACDRPESYPMEKRFPYYRERGNRMLDFFSQKAKENNTYIAYSAARELSDGTWRNTTQIIDRKGMVIGTYDKNYPTVGETDIGKILPGADASIIDCDFGRVGCAICFDLNFEPIRKRYEQLQPDMILFSSMYHGGLMANYWAYSCRTYLAGAICGLENHMISPVGEKVSFSTNYFHFLTTTVNLDYRVIHLDENWGKIADMKRKYGSKVKMTDPGYLGAVLISSETDEFTINDMINEFGIENLDEYMKRSMGHRDECLIK
jgi:hypothetical protein